MAAILAFSAIAAGCAVTRAPTPPPGAARVGAISTELASLSGTRIAPLYGVFDAVLSDALDKDAYVCAPAPRDVFFGAAPEGSRLIDGTMPHYGLFFGPMRYLVRKDTAGYSVEVGVAVEPPGEATLLTLPDCDLAGQLDGERACAESSAGPDWESEICPSSAVFAATATKKTVRALLARWSKSVEEYFNRDARGFGLPVRYDFEFFLAGEAAGRRVDITLPLADGCGRTPYFAAIRSGWPLPVIAHEMGHVLGLLDEFEDAAELFGLRYRSPSGLEASRMGEARRESSMVLPVHHYLVLRRYFCPEPGETDPFAALPL